MYVLVHGTFGEVSKFRVVGHFGDLTEVDRFLQRHIPAGFSIAGIHKFSKPSKMQNDKPNTMILEKLIPNALSPEDRQLITFTVRDQIDDLIPAIEHWEEELEASLIQVSHDET